MGAVRASGSTELIASYNASTPVGTFIEISARGRTVTGHRGSWDSLGRWASHDTRLPPDVARRATRRPRPGRRRHPDRPTRDAPVARGSCGCRCSGAPAHGRTPVVTMTGAVASRLPGSSPTSRPGSGAGHSLVVPRYSQEIHRGEYPQYNGGGEAWCSPTSTSMVMGFWHRLPTPDAVRLGQPRYRQPVGRPRRALHLRVGLRRHRHVAVQHRVRRAATDSTRSSPGCGRCARRSCSSRPASRWWRRSRSVAGSSTARRSVDERPPRGDPRLHGRAVASSSTTPPRRRTPAVRRVYRRGQFENAWSDNGGVVYVIHPRSKALPAPAHHSNW